jgi:inner membrane protein
MTGRTHDLTAFTLLNGIFLYSPLTSMSLSTLFVALGANLIGGLTPDIDQPTAELWNRIPAGSVIGRILCPILGSHRMISHSILGVFVFAFLSGKFLDAIHEVLRVDMGIVWMSFMIGFISHLLIDVITKDGEPWFFPLPFKVGIPPIRALRIKTGGIAEKSLIFPGLMLLNGYMIYSHYLKYLEFLRTFIK